MTQSLEGSFNPAVHFLGLIKKTIADGAVRSCALGGGPKLVIAPHDMAYYTAAGIHELQALCLAQPFDLEIETLTNWAPATRKETLQTGRMQLRVRADHPLAGLPPRPLAELLWHAAMSASNGRLLQGCRADDPVHLKHWPDFSVLPHQENHLKLAEFMYASNVDLLTVAQHTGVPLAQVFDFHNACAILGLIERGNVFDPDEHLIGTIRKSLTDGCMRRCVLPGLPPLFLAPKERRYYSQADGASLAPFYSASLGDMQVEVVQGLESETEEEVIQIGRMWVRRKKEKQALSLPSGSLEKLLWNTALKASRGRLLADKRDNDVVRLKRWPDFSRLPHERCFLSMAAFMSSNAADLPTIAQYIGIPPAQVIDFHNACAVLGLLEYPAEAQVQQRRISDGEREIYRNISRSLGGMKEQANA